jgi:hypothetical protein
MKLFVKNFPALLILAVLLFGDPLARAGKKNDDTGGFSGPAASASPTPPPPKFNIPIPPGHDARGVKLPYFDPQGRLQMYFVIAKALRLDLDHLAMKTAYMQTYDDKGAPDANVFMSSSVLDLNTRIVTSDVPVTVRRSDFVIVGQKMVFNTQTHIGHMAGYVHMIIYNRQDMSDSSPSPSPSGNSSPAPQPSRRSRPSITP